MDINHLVDLLNNKIVMTYDSTNNIVTVYSEGKQIATDCMIGGSEGIQEGFYRGKFIHYVFNNGTVKVNCEPVIILQERDPTDSYLKNGFLEADIKFEYDSNGIINGFDDIDKGLMGLKCHLNFTPLCVFLKVSPHVLS